MIRQCGKKVEKLNNGNCLHTFKGKRMLENKGTDIEKKQVKKATNK